MQEHSAGYMMGGSDTFLMEGTAEEFGSLFMYEGHKKPIRYDITLFEHCHSGTLYVKDYWYIAHPLIAEAVLIDNKQKLYDFICVYNAEEYPLIAWERDSAEFNILRFTGKFHEGKPMLAWLKRQEDIFPFRIIRARFKEDNVSYANPVPVRKRSSYKDENITVGKARDVGPFYDSCGIDVGETVYICTHDEFAVSSEGNEAFYCSFHSSVVFPDFKHLVATIENCEVKDCACEFDVSEQYVERIMNDKNIDAEEFEEFEILDEDGSPSDFPCMYYSVSFERRKSLDIFKWCDFVSLVKRWRRNTKKWGAMTVECYCVRGDW